MRSPRILTVGVLLLIACDSPTTPIETGVVDSGLSLSLDTLNVEIQNLWVRIGAATATEGGVTLQWELTATTANPYWRPATLALSGAREFDGPGAAQIWGNVPRAYDFQLIVTGLDGTGHRAVDTLTVEAPLCRDASRPGLVCNPGVRGGSRRGD